MSARTVLRRDGAVLVPGYQPTLDGIVRAAADLLGPRLHRITSVKPVQGDNGAILLHTDGGSSRRQYRAGESCARSFREDYLFLLCEKPADHGGDSILADGYRLIDALGTEPAMSPLVAFLTEIDLDPGGLPASPPRGERQALRMVEYTRTGRRIFTVPPGVGVLPNDLLENEHKDLLDLWADIIATVSEVAPRFRLEPGEALCIDNYRCLHGRDDFDGERVMHALRSESIDAI